MLSGATLRASEIAGTAVFRIVVSSDSMKNATATSHGKSRLLAVDGENVDEGWELTGVIGFAWRKKYSTPKALAETAKKSTGDCRLEGAPGVRRKKEKAVTRPFFYL